MKPIQILVAVLALLPLPYGVASAEESEVVATAAPTIPNVEVVNQNGTPLKFYDDLIKDRVVAINFVFSSCPTICPLMEVNFQQLQQALKDSPQKGTQLISVSVDPVTDTPARLKQWSRKFGAEDGWSFITGEKNTIVGLLKKMEVFTADIDLHPSFILMGDDATGRWKRVNSLASASVLASELQKLSAQSETSKQ